MIGKCQICKSKDVPILTIGRNDFKGGISICTPCRRNWNAYFELHSPWTNCHWKEAFNTWRNTKGRTAKEVVQFT